MRAPAFAIVPPLLALSMTAAAEPADPGGCAKRDPALLDRAPEIHVSPLRFADGRVVLRALQPMIECLRRTWPAPADLRLSWDEATNSIVYLTPTHEDAEAIRQALVRLDVARSVLLDLAFVETTPGGRFWWRMTRALPDDVRRTVFSTRDPAVLDRREVLVEAGATREIRVDGAGDAGYRVTIAAHTGPSDQIRLNIEAGACAWPRDLRVTPCSLPRMSTILVVRDEQPVALRALDREGKTFFMVLVPHLIGDEKLDLPRLLAARAEEAQRARDQEAVFGDARTPLHVRRTSRGLVALIRGAQEEAEARRSLSPKP